MAMNLVPVVSGREAGSKKAYTLISLLLILESRIYKVLQGNGENLLIRLHKGASSKVISSSQLQHCWGSCKCIVLSSENKEPLRDIKEKTVELIKPTSPDLSF